MCCFHAAEWRIFTREHLGTGFSYSMDFSGITSVVWLRVHFEVTKLYTNNKTVSPLLHCFQGAISVLLQGLASFQSWFYFVLLNGFLFFHSPAFLHRREIYQSILMATLEMAGFYSTLPNVHVFCIKGSLMKTALFLFSAFKGAADINVKNYIAALGYQFNHFW